MAVNNPTGMAGQHGKADHWLLGEHWETLLRCGNDCIVIIPHLFKCCFYSTNRFKRAAKMPISQSVP